jgi:hypothetical protein
MAASSKNLKIVQFLAGYYPPLIEESVTNAANNSFFNILDLKGPRPELEETFILLCALKPMTFYNTPFTLNMNVINELKKLVPFISLGQHSEDFHISLDWCACIDETLLEKCLEHLPVSLEKENRILSQLHVHEAIISRELEIIKQIKASLDGQMLQYPEDTEESVKERTLLNFYKTNYHATHLNLETLDNKVKAISAVYRSHLSDSLLSRCMACLTDMPETVQELLTSQEPHIKQTLDLLDGTSFLEIPLGQRAHASSFKDLLQRKSLKQGLNTAQ